MFRSTIPFLYLKKNLTVLIYNFGGKPCLKTLYWTFFITLNMNIYDFLIKQKYWSMMEFCTPGIHMVLYIHIYSEKAWVHICAYVRVNTYLYYITFLKVINDSQCDII